MAAVVALNNAQIMAAMINAPDGTPPPGLSAGATGATVIPANNVHADEDWSIAGGCPVDVGTATNAPNGAYNNHIVLPDINISQVIYWFKRNYPTVVREQQELIFGTLTQASDSVRNYYRKINKYASWAQISDREKRIQFIRGLTPENKLEMKRLDIARGANDDYDSGDDPVDDITDKPDSDSSSNTSSNDSSDSDSSSDDSSDSGGDITIVASTETKIVSQNDVSSSSKNLDESSLEEESLDDPMKINFVKKKEPKTSVATIKCKIRHLKIPAMTLDSGAEPPIITKNIVDRTKDKIDKSEKHDLSSVATVPIESIGIVRNLPITLAPGNMDAQWIGIQMS
ncbi:hypothetical protein GLOIN_2v1886689 [Rhizophagus clarus]|uniref:Retrotransposon gag domain-containing protein n=1 Tax=Rhizophagus clarus TaxID=94130 RepID=A0A8H3LX75_9GLOM|nr:hypothetical protein GLOIN_2v1886689 [Rhizophagus clarus]